MIIMTDIHGHYKTMLALIEKVRLDEFPDRPIVIAGDLVDRGPDSYNVVKYVIDNNIDMVMGNHEDMMCRAILDGDPSAIMDWHHNGGAKAKWSYEVAPANTMKEHAEFLAKQPTFRVYDDYQLFGRKLLVSHSSIGNYWKNGEEYPTKFEKDFVIWNRDCMNEGGLKDLPEYYNVFGHTPGQGVMIKDFCANIDTCAYSSRPGNGYLTALVYPEMKIFKQRNIDNV